MSSFAINGTQILVDPLRHHWVRNNELDRDGTNRPIYAGIRAYELFWPVMTPAQFDAWIDNYVATSTTGTVSVTIPEYSSATYSFKTYTGVTVDHPEYDDYFEGHFTNVRVLLNNLVP